MSRLSLKFWSLTEFGQVSERLRHRPAESEFEQCIRRFGYLLTEVTFVLIIAILGISVYFSRPILDETAASIWAARSLDFAFAYGASVAVLIPTRSGNGALEVLTRFGEFSPPRLATLEAARAYGLWLKRGRVFADLWDLGRFAVCAHCTAARSARLNEMNRQQAILPPVKCEICGE
jgi:hypothetical protein